MSRIISETAPDTRIRGFSGIAAILGDIKFAHTVFALPFALASAHLAFLRTGGYRLDKLLLILLCMVTARTAAMSFNRYVDRDLDSENPRTTGRSIPSGRARPSDALLVIVVCSVVFLAACYFLGTWPLALSIPALAFLFAYSLIKRFTVLTHLWLGASLAIAPTGAWVAITGSWSLIPVVLSIAVVFWVAGFDVLYALQDIEFDRSHRVFSVPRSLGIKGSLWIARGLHIASFAVLILFGWITGIGWPYWVVLAIVGTVLGVEHLMVRADDLSRVGVAFFTMNGIVSILIYAGVLISTLPQSGVAF
jgi:4-hydroxybenzoate polyprenyltransferase